MIEVYLWGLIPAFTFLCGVYTSMDLFDGNDKLGNTIAFLALWGLYPLFIPFVIGLGIGELGNK
jgi:hypothetical protein